MNLALLWSARSSLLLGLWPEELGRSKGCSPRVAGPSVAVVAAGHSIRIGPGCGVHSTGTDSRPSVLAAMGSVVAPAGQHSCTGWLNGSLNQERLCTIRMGNGGIRTGRSSPRDRLQFGSNGIRSGASRATSYVSIFKGTVTTPINRRSQRSSRLNSKARSQHPSIAVRTAGRLLLTPTFTSASST